MHNGQKPACPQGHEYDEANTIRKNGRRYCRACRNERARKYKRKSRSVRAHRRYLADRCERCGFVPEHLCQLDAHHRDGNHDNNDPANLGTLCANCHRLEHQAKGQNRRR